MGYIDELNSFQRWILTEPTITTSEIALWYALMHYNNTTGWKEEFNVAINVLEVSTKMTSKTILKARNRLKQLGRIDFYSRGGRQSAVYRIIPFVGNNSQQMVQQTVQQIEPLLVQQPVQQSVYIPRIEENRLLSTNTNVLVEGESPPAKEKKKATRKVFVKPTPLEIQSYVDEHNLQIDPERFFDYYEGNGWKVGKNPMKDWKATARNWSRRNEENGGEYNKRTRVTTKNEPKTDEYADLYL